MTIHADKFSKAVLSALSDQEREARLRELESVLNQKLAGCESLPQFQQKLYSQIEELVTLGFSLGRWDYDSEVEVWGGPSYIDKNKKDDLLLRSQFPAGVSLAWKEFERLAKDS